MKAIRVDGGRDLRQVVGAWAVYVFLIVAAMVILFGSGCSLKTAQITHVAVQSADLASTHYAESRGAVEANPLFQANWATRVGLKSAASVGMWIATSQLDRMGHPRLAKSLLYTLNAVLAGVIVNNVRIARGR